MASLGELFVTVGAKIDGFERAMGTVNKNLKDLDKEWSGATAGFDKLFGRLQDVGMTLSASVTLPLVGAGAAAMSMYGDFEYAMNAVSAKAGITGKDLDALKALALDLGAKTKFSATDAAQGMAELAAKGYDTRQIMETIPGVMALAATETMSVGDAARITSAAINIFGLEMSQAGHVADVLALASAKTATSTLDLGQALSYVGPIAKQAGLSLEETASMLALLSDKGLDAERAGTGLRGVIAGLVNPSQDAAKTIEQFGINLKDAHGNMLPIPTILDQMKSSGMAAGDVMNVFGREASSAASGLMETGVPAVTSLTTALQNSDGAAKKMADTMNKGWKGATEQLKGSIESAGVALATVLEPVLLSITKTLQNLVDGFSSFMQWLSKTPQWVQTCAAAFAALLAAIGPVLLAVGALGAALPSIVAGFALVSTAMKTMLIAPMMQLPAMITNISTALSGNLVGALTLAEKSLLVLGTAAAMAAAAFVGWKLGEWAYENIPALKALGDAIGGLIGMIPGVESLMNRLTGATAALGHANKDAEGQTKLFEARLKSHGLTLDRGSMSAQEYNEKALAILKTHQKSEESTKKVGEAHLDLSKAHGKVIASSKEYEKALKSWEKANEDARASANQSNVVWRTTQEEVRRVAEKKEALIRSIVDLKLQLRDQPRYLDEVSRSLDEMATSLEGARIESNKLKGSVPEMADTLRVQLRDIPKATASLEDAFKTLGIKSSTTFDEMAKDAEAAYKAVMGSGVATDWEKKNALLAMLKAQAEAMKANGKEIPEDMEQLMVDLEGKVNAKSPSLVGPNGTWTKLASSMAQVVGDLSKDLIDSLFEGDKSWAEKGKAALKTLGETVLSAFVTPAAQALQNFINGVLADLLSGKGFGALLDKIKGIGTAITDIFGSGGSAAGAMTGAGAGAGTGGAGIPTGPGGTGGVSGAVSSAAQWTTAIGSIGSFVTGVISNFQNMAMNKSFDLIVKHTLQMVMIGEVMYEMTFHVLTEIHDRLITLISHGIGVWNAEGDTLRVRTDRDGELFYHLESMDFGVSQLNYTMLEIRNAIVGLPDAVSMMGAAQEREYRVPIVVNVDGREVARALVNYLDVQGARA